jgi:hypothetical protein
MMRLIIVSTLVAVTAVGAGGYYLVHRTEVSHVETVESSTPAPPPPPAADDKDSRESMHGDFDKRFQPKPPKIYGEGKQ